MECRKTPVLMHSLELFAAAECPAMMLCTGKRGARQRLVIQRLAERQWRRAHLCSAEGHFVPAEDNVAVHHKADDSHDTADGNDVAGARVRQLAGSRRNTVG